MLHELAGRSIPKGMLCNIPRLISQYYLGQPDPREPRQRVAFGTSGHRGSALELSFNEAHVLAIIQAIAQRCGGRLDFANHPDGLRASLWVPLQTASTERDPPDLGSPRKRTFPDKPDAEGNQPWQAGPATPR